MRYFLIFLPFFTSLLLYAEINEVAISENDPNSLVEGVSVITGDLYRYEEDVVVQGVQPLKLSRSYFSQKGEGSWDFFSYQELFVKHSSGNTTNTLMVEVTEPSGAILLYGGVLVEEEPSTNDRESPRYSYIFSEPCVNTKGMCNTKGGLSGRYNLKNQRIALNKYTGAYTISCPDGTRRIYYPAPSDNFSGYRISHKRARVLEGSYYHYILAEESLPNGNVIVYEWPKKHENTWLIKSCDPTKKIIYAWAKFKMTRGEKMPNGGKRSFRDFDVTTSDGRYFQYFYKEGMSKAYLSKVTSAEKPEENFEYLSYKGKEFLSSVNLPDKRGVSYTYYIPDKVGEKDKRCFRVKEILSPLQENGDKVVTHTFIYDVKNRNTTVLDAYGNSTVYYWNQELRLTQIDRFSAKDTFYNRTKFIWGGSGTQDETNLIGKILFNEKKEPTQAVNYLYDEYGNVEHEKLYGNLTGDGTVVLPLHSKGYPSSKTSEVYEKHYKYTRDGRHLLFRQEEDSGAKKVFSYLGSTSLIAKEECYDVTELCWTKTYIYNGYNNLIKEELKDNLGPTHTITTYVLNGIYDHYPCMPKVVEERAGGNLLRKTEISYVTGGRIDRKSIFDSEGAHCYDLTYGYTRGLVETETNALKHEAYSEYDSLNNKIKYRPYGLKSEVTMGYDTANRLRWIYEVDREKKGRDYNYNYNYLHQKTEEWDEYKSYTSYKYDAQGNLLKTYLPGGGVVSSTYNGEGHEVSRTDARGNTTYTRYNVYGSPIEISCPDGYKEYFRYYRNGTLRFHKDKAGVETFYTYDAFGRLRSKQKAGAEETFTYDSFHVLTETDPEGYTTYYTYDEAGRKIGMRQGEELTTYTYDHLGRPFRETYGELVQVIKYNYLDQIEEERKEDLEGNVLHKVQYGYDEAGDQISITRFIEGKEAKEIIDYDAFHRVITKRDPLGFVTTYSYQWIPHETTQVDALGLTVVETYNALNKLESLRKYSKEGVKLLATRYYYDFNGNMDREERTSEGHTKVVAREYDEMNLVKLLVEGAGSPEQKVTSYTYTPTGLLFTVVKPSGLILTHTYDDLEYPKTLSSSDGSIIYRYQYDKEGNLRKSLDEITSHEILRKYDRHGSLVKETFPAKLTVKKTYDAQGRPKTLELPGGSIVRYEYDALYLRRVSHRHYAHTYMEYDLAGNLLKEELPLNQGTVSYGYDSLGRRVFISSPYFTQTASFDPVGNLISTIRQGEHLTYTYDSLYQLTSEKDHTYAFDAQYNRIMKDHSHFSINDLNQTSELSYNSDGNPESFQGKRLFYDALDRLVRVEGDGKIIQYRYDSLHRRLSKQVFVLTAEGKTCIDTRYYLYDGQNEIGSYDASFTLKDLRILGATPSAEIGASIAIELNGDICIPFHDLHGNVASIKLASGSVENYSYTAFGEEKFSSPPSCNPWRFSSKRTDEETSFVYYGRRYYSPTVGRFLTPDPLGLEASPNLYAFVLNSPLTHLDLYGLLEQEGNWWSSPEFLGSLQMIGGMSEAAIGGALMLTSPLTFGITGVLGAGIMAHGLDNAIAGGFSAFTGTTRDSLTVQALEGCGMSHQWANTTNDCMGIFGSFGGTKLIMDAARAVPQVASSVFSSTSASSKSFQVTEGSLVKSPVGTNTNSANMVTMPGQVAKSGAQLTWPSASGGRSIINGIEYTTHALERMSPRGLIQSGTEIISRGVPTSVVENAIKFGSKTQGNTCREVIHVFENIRVITDLNEKTVITVIKTGK